eukprot:408866-Amphidinium_carterae.1
MNRLWLPGLVFTLCGLISSNPHFRRLSDNRAEFLAVVRALEECKPKSMLSEQVAGNPKEDTWMDLECRALAALPAGVEIVWMKAHQSDRDAEESF